MPQDKEQLKLLYILILDNRVFIQPLKYDIIYASWNRYIKQVWKFNNEVLTVVISK